MATLTVGIEILTPQFAAIEAHGVKPVGILANANRVAVWKDVAPYNTHHFACMPARVSWQARVLVRMDIARAHLVGRP